MTYDSINKLAKRMGISRPTCTEWLKHKRFPLHRTPPWSEADAEVLDDWRTTLQANRADAAYQTKAPTDPSDKEFWLTRKYRAQALQQEGRLIDADAMLDAWREVRSMVRAEVVGIAESCQAVVGLTDEQTAKLRAHTAEVLDAVQDRVAMLADNVNPIQEDTDEPNRTR